jgi:hypothetical protein
MRVLSVVCGCLVWACSCCVLDVCGSYSHVIDEDKAALDAALKRLLGSTYDDLCKRRVRQVLQHGGGRRLESPSERVRRFALGPAAAKLDDDALRCGSRSGGHAGSRAEDDEEQEEEGDSEEEGGRDEDDNGSGDSNSDDDDMDDERPTRGLPFDDYVTGALKKCPLV